MIACSPSWYLTWHFLSFPTFGYLIKYLTEFKEASQGLTENYRSENAISQPSIAEMNIGFIVEQLDLLEYFFLLSNASRQPLVDI